MHFETISIGFYSCIVYKINIKYTDPISNACFDILFNITFGRYLNVDTNFSNEKYLFKFFDRHEFVKWWKESGHLWWTGKVYGFSVDFTAKLLIPKIFELK